MHDIPEPPRGDLQLATHAVSAVFIRLPQPGQRCPITGLSRSTMNELVLPSPLNDYRPPVKSRLLRKRGASRGIRLVDHASLIEYLRSLPETQSDEEGGE